jgi:NhaP-type Na+/H+ or K+/H+ antiporter
MLGAVLGPSGLGLVDLNLQSPALRVIATLGLLLVLFSDSISVDVGAVRKQRRLALAVLGPGTLLPAALIAVAAWLLLDLSAPAALILGAALASTDPVLLRSLLRRPELPDQTRIALRMESGMNDVVLLPIVILSIVAVQSSTAASSPRIGHHLVGLFVLGPLLGALVGWVAITLLDQVRRRFTVRRDYESLYALGVAFTAFAAAEAVGGSGFVAAFAAGLVIAALDVELCDCFLDYGEASAEMFLLLTFVAFGSSLIWSGLDVADWRTVLFAVIALAVRTLVLLPVLRHAGVTDRSRRLIAWLGPRGLSSLLLVLLPVFAGVPGAERLFAITSLVVLLSVVLHGGGIALLLRREATTAPMSTSSSPATREPASTAHGVALDGGTAVAAATAQDATSAEKVPEVITVPELRELQARGEPVLIVDARTERSTRDDPLQAQGAIRIPPDNAVKTARDVGLAQHATLVVYCA